MPDPVVRIASVPAGHPYVRAVRVPGHVVLPDPPVPGAPAGVWWPPQVLDRAWLRANAGTFDLVHVHFGVESLSVDRLGAALATLRELDVPLVHTVHDLVHPHLVDQARHREQLGLLVGAADELLTLTDGAAEVLRDEFGRDVEVVPHPQLAPDAWFARADAIRAGRTVRGDGGPGRGERARGDDPARGDRLGGEGSADRPLVGLHLRGLRANVRPDAWVGRLADAVRERGGTLRIVVNDDVRDGTPAGDALARVLGAAGLEGAQDTIAGAGGPVRAGVPGVDVVRRPRPDDDGLARELAGLDVSVLPYAHGTHSGWFELCWDLGVPVLSPDVGAIAGQHDEAWALATFDPGRPDGIVDALDRLLAAGPAPPAAERLAARRRVRDENRRVHLAVYRRALGGGRGVGPTGGTGGGGV